MLPFLTEQLPSALLAIGPGKLAWWQWLALPVALVSAWVLGRWLSKGSLALLRKLTLSTSVAWDDALLACLEGPLSVAWAFGVAYLIVELLDLPAPAENGVERVLRAGFLIVFFWSQVRLVDWAGELLAEGPAAKSRPASRALITLGGRVLKLLTVAAAVVAVLSELDYPVGSLLAGLGIGGIALALAAQKTLENLIGTVAIGVDQPFRVGDFIRVEDVIGTVEAIGLRSTRIRTADRTVITIPNGKLADQRIESYSVRDRMRFACDVGLLHGTTPRQIREILASVEAILRARPGLWPDEVVVRFKAIGSTSLDLEIMAWFQVATASELQQIRQELLLEIMAAVEQAGTAFASPTRIAPFTPP